MNKDINNSLIVNTDNDALITYNNGADKITKRDIYNLLELSASEHIKDFECLDDLTEKCSSSKFNIILQDIGNLFKSTKALYITKSANAGDNYIYNNNIQWEYDKYKLLSLVPVYVELCYEFNKRVSDMGFLYFCGIGNVNYFIYDEHNAVLSENLRTKIHEKLDFCDNEQQKNLARDSKQPILNIAYNNYVHGWNGEIKRNEINGTIKSLEDIKKARAELSGNDTQ